MNSSAKNQQFVQPQATQAVVIASDGNERTNGRLLCSTIPSTVTRRQLWSGIISDIWSFRDWATEHCPRLGVVVLWGMHTRIIIDPTLAKALRDEAKQLARFSPENQRQQWPRQDSREHEDLFSGAYPGHFIAEKQAQPPNPVTTAFLRDHFGIEFPQAIRVAFEGETRAIVATWAMPLLYEGAIVFYLRGYRLGWRGDVHTGRCAWLESSYVIGAIERRNPVSGQWSDCYPVGMTAEQKWLPTLSTWNAPSQRAGALPLPGPSA